VSYLVAGVTPPGAIADFATGLVLVAVAVVGWVRRPQSRVGPLIALTGVTWLAGDVWSALVYAHRGPLVHTLLTHPSGRARSPLAVAIIALAYIDGLIPALARSPWPTLALGTVVVGAAAARFATARGVERKATLVPLAGAAATWGALALAAIGRLTDAGTGGLAAWGYELAIALTAVALVVDLVSERPARAAATGLVVDLGSAGEGAEGVRAAIARAVGDPGLAILYRADGQWVDEAGRRARLPGAGADKQVSTISGEDGAPVAAIVHDRAALRDETLARSVAAAARLAVANVRLQADVAERVLEVAASRRRLVEASDVERRRLSEQLRAGAESRLATVAGELQQLAAHGGPNAAPTLNGLVVELEAARDDLARFAQGVHPRALTDHGLPEALRVLAAQAALPVELDVPAIRMPAPQEAALYFVCSEALANVAKYADASEARIAVVADDAGLRVHVTDDGRGGADPAAGSGLRGLADRVEALGGRLFVDSQPGRGTTVAAVLPQSEAVVR
jgi:signal transduction histidine kinase